MEELQYVRNLLKNNIKLLIVCVVVAITGGIIHHKLEPTSYVTSFELSSGSIGLSLFKSANDFVTLRSEFYNLPEDTLEVYRAQLKDFSISTNEKNEHSFKITFVSKNKDADHSEMQKSFLNLVNNNLVIQNNLRDNIDLMDRKINLLSKKVEQIDSIMFNPSNSSHISNAPYYSYELNAERLDLEFQKSKLGNFDVVLPLSEVSAKKRPLIMFVGLYLVLMGFVFLIFSKKKGFSSN